MLAFLLMILSASGEHSTAVPGVDGVIAIVALLWTLLVAPLDVIRAVKENLVKLHRKARRRRPHPTEHTQHPPAPTAHHHYKRER